MMNNTRTKTAFKWQQKRQLEQQQADHFWTAADQG